MFQLTLFAAVLGVPVDTNNLPEARIDANWGTRSVSLHVPGRDAPSIGIFNRDTQITLTRARTKTIFERLEKAKFDKMPESFGGLPEPKGGGPRPLRPEILVGSVSLTVKGKTHSVTQRGGGEQSDELAALAKSILDVCEAAAKEGIKAKDFKDGLQKIQKQQLRPETVRALVHRLPEGNKGDAFLLRLDGRIVVTRDRTAAGYGPEKKLDLTEKELADLLQVMLDNAAGELPINLWAEHYTDLVVGVLQHEKNMQARQFAGMTPQTHGEKQKHFDAIFAEMLKLHRRAMKEGRAVKAPK